MIKGLGTDITDIMRTGRLTSAAITKAYHPKEIEAYEKLKDAAEEIRFQYLAGRYAVKEAYAKARGLGFCDIIKPNEICTTTDENKKPVVELYGITKENDPGYEILCTISHSMPKAVAIVLLQDKE